ncbi:hypothetical protein EGW08_015857 [Elysia chlorotica]|uniref:Polyamine-modulated factor 1 n=1 Tax=Elysia chlorotica TaxID=188477 RepID=A0A433T4A0_ELYCH|nr:hypothetical protein EGW08_015857 [Elysia chlorotica]
MTSEDSSKRSAERMGDEKSSTSIKDSEPESDSDSNRLPKAYEKLQNATEKAVKRLTSKIKVMPFIKEHFRKHYEADKKYFLEVYKSMMDQLEMMIMDEVNLQLEANDVKQLLSDLEKTIEQNPATDRIWRPSGNPEEDVKAHLEKSTSEEVQQLEKILSSLECQNKLLNSHVARTDQRLENSMKTLQSHEQAWHKAASMMMDQKTQQAFTDIHTKMNRGTRPNNECMDSNTQPASSHCLTGLK